MIKPIKSFRAVIPGSAYPVTFTPESELKPNSVAAKAALDLGYLCEEDVVTVREALGLGEDQTGAAADKAAADKAAADKAAADKAAADKAAADKAAADKAAADKAAADKAA
ncbi:hypothetical protein, partial [Pacificoceanicola onchidii]|uniref:hypothetical protein n=1 Tax=Pacificoceanicola onchidii TaxID=2562685 RepID=UPI001F114E44